MLFTLQEIVFMQSKKRSARMRTTAYKVDVASDRRRRGKSLRVDKYIEVRYSV